MKIVFRKDPTKKYCCDECGKQFNWNKDSVRYGKMEYKTIQEEREIDRTFCSDECADIYLNAD